MRGHEFNLARLIPDHLGRQASGVFLSGLAFAGASVALAESASGDTTTSASVTVSAMLSGLNDLNATLTANAAPADPNATVSDITWSIDGGAPQYEGQQSVQIDYPEDRTEAFYTPETAQATVDFSDGEEAVSPLAVYYPNEPINTIPLDLTSTKMYVGDTHYVPVSEVLANAQDSDSRDLDGHELTVTGVEPNEDCQTVEGSDGQEHVALTDPQPGYDSCEVDISNQEIKDNGQCYKYDGSIVPCTDYTWQEEIDFKASALNPAGVSLHSPQKAHQGKKDGELDVTVTDKNSGKTSPDYYTIQVYSDKTKKLIKTLPATKLYGGQSETAKTAVGAGRYTVDVYEKGLEKPTFKTITVDMLHPPITARIVKRLVFAGTMAQVDYHNYTKHDIHLTTKDAGRVHHFIAEPNPQYHGAGAIDVTVPHGKHQLKVFQGNSVHGKLLAEKWLHRKK